MSEQTLHIGIVGAGANTRSRHLPNLQAIPGVEVVSVCNRSRESSERVAGEFGIPKVYDHWSELVAAEDTDAIVIGTWPYLHCPVTLAALEADKHVLTEARMAMNAAEAHQMLQYSRARPHLVTQVVPSPATLRVDRTVKKLIAAGYLGETRFIEVRAFSPALGNPDAPLHWRHNRSLSGFNTLELGIWYEALMRWVGGATRVMATTQVFVKQRRDPVTEAAVAVTVPDHVDVLAEMACGAQAHMLFTSVAGALPDIPPCQGGTKGGRHSSLATLHSEGSGIWLHGTRGTLYYEAETEKLFGRQENSADLSEIAIPPAQEGHWRVEEEFINAIRGLEPVRLTTFEDGACYMEFTEAVIRSAQEGCTVSLPL